LLLTEDSQNLVLDSITIEMSGLKNGSFTLKKEFKNFNIFCFYYGLDYVSICKNVKQKSDTFFTKIYDSNFDFLSTVYEKDKTINYIKENNVSSVFTFSFEDDYSRIKTNADASYINKSGDYVHIYSIENFENKNTSIYVKVANKFRWFITMLIGSLIIVSIILLILTIKELIFIKKNKQKL